LYLALFFAGGGFFVKYVKREGDGSMVAGEQFRLSVGVRTENLHRVRPAAPRFSAGLAAAIMKAETHPSFRRIFPMNFNDGALGPQIFPKGWIFQ